MTTVVAAVLGAIVGMLLTLGIYQLTGSVLLMAVVGLPLAFVSALLVGVGVGVLGASRR